MKVDMKAKRNELIWALSMQMVDGHRQYDNQEIADIFNLNRSTILRIISQKPNKWKTKWIKSTIK